MPGHISTGSCAVNSCGCPLAPTATPAAPQLPCSPLPPHRRHGKGEAAAAAQERSAQVPGPAGDLPDGGSGGRRGQAVGGAGARWAPPAAPPAACCLAEPALGAAGSPALLPDRRALAAAAWQPPQPPAMPAAALPAPAARRHCLRSAHGRLPLQRRAWPSPCTPLAAGCCMCAGLQRQVVYGGLRIGLYEPIRNAMVRLHGAHPVGWPGSQPHVASKPCCASALMPAVAPRCAHAPVSCRLSAPPMHVHGCSWLPPPGRCPRATRGSPAWESRLLRA